MELINKYLNILLYGGEIRGNEWVSENGFPKLTNIHTFDFKNNVYCINNECVRLKAKTLRSLYKGIVK